MTFSLSHTHSLTHSLTHTLIIACISGQAVMNSVVHAIASTGELYSLMQYLEEKFHWGTIRENFHCNIVQNATDGKWGVVCVCVWCAMICLLTFTMPMCCWLVDCASRTAMALQMFGLFFLILAAKRDAKQALIPSSKLSSPVSIRLACVHVLLRCDKLGNFNAPGLIYQSCSILLILLNERLRFCSLASADQSRVKRTSWFWH